MAILRGTAQAKRHVRYWLDCTGLSEKEYAIFFEGLSAYVRCRGPMRRNPVDPNIPYQFIPTITIVFDKAATIGLGVYAGKKAIDVIGELIEEIGKEIIRKRSRRKRTLELTKPDGTKVKLDF